MSEFLETPIKINIFSDADFNEFQFMPVNKDDILTYAEMKTQLDTVLGKMSKRQTEPVGDIEEVLAKAKIQIHVYSGAPSICLEQDAGKWKIVYRNSMSTGMYNALKDIIE